MRGQRPGPAVACQLVHSPLAEATVRGQLRLCAVRYATGRPYITSHLASSMVDNRILSDTPDDHVCSCFKQAAAVSAGEGVTGSEASIHLPLLLASTNGEHLEGAAAAGVGGPDGGEVLGVVQVNYTRGTISMTHSEMELLQVSASLGGECQFRG